MKNIVKHYSNKAKQNKYLFTMRKDYHKMEIDVVSGTETNDKFVIRYTTKDYISKNYKYGETITFELTLNKVNGVYQFVSNVIV